MARPRGLLVPYYNLYIVGRAKVRFVSLLICLFYYSLLSLLKVLFYLGLGVLKAGGEYSSFLPRESLADHWFRGQLNPHTGIAKSTYAKNFRGIRRVHLLPSPLHTNLYCAARATYAFYVIMLIHLHYPTQIPHLEYIPLPPNYIPLYYSHSSYSSIYYTI